QIAAPLDVTADFVSSQSIGLLRSYYSDDPSQSTLKPTSVEILTSPDNNTYTSRGSTPAASAVQDDLHVWHYDLSVTGVSARYVRFRVTSPGQALLKIGRASCRERV